MLRPAFALFALSVTLVAATSQSQAAPSFDCSKARLPDEKAICASADLSALDVALNDGYQRLIAKLGRATANKIHAPFLRQRHACKSDADCIAKVGANEIPMFQLVDASFGPPTGFVKPPEEKYDDVKLRYKIGECLLGQVIELGPRLCSPDANGDCHKNLPFDDSGDIIAATSGFFAVEYERVAAIEKSKLGDTVLLCLKSIPRNCPKDDDRGYVWDWKNLRTNGKWNSPDSQHMCGGA